MRLATRSSLILLAALIMLLAGGRAQAVEPTTDPPSRLPSDHTVAPNGFPGLTLDERLACRAAVEEVYWNHRLWPAENPGPKPAFSEMVPAAVIQTKAENGLRATNALLDLWGQEITGDMLQAEINRMAAATQQPAVLAEIWAALHNDPLLVAECLARPALANRLLRNFHAGGEAGPDSSFNDWWAANADRYPVEQPVAPAFAYALPEISAALPAGQTIEGDDDSWQATPAIPFYTDGTAVWSGAEMLIFGGSGSNQGYLYDPATDTWDQMNTLNNPNGRREHTAVWTGTEMIVWGGCTGSSHACDLKTGGRYNPVTNTWTPTSIPANVSSRTRHGAVWTGDVMVIWGGCRYAALDTCTIIPPEGGRYNPLTDSWETTSTVNQPQGRTNPRMVWTGSQVLVWSSASFPGGRYDPVADTWQSMSSVNAPPGTLGTLIWTGSEAIAWGGCTGSPNCQTPENTGGRYDPVTDTWTPTSTTNAPEGRWFQGAVWTGEEMIVWGGSTGSSWLNSGGRYNPATDTWTPTSMTNVPSARYSMQIVWTGDLMIVWGGRFGSRTGGRYAPATDSWTPVSTNDPGANRARHAAVWTGTEMIIWGGEVGVQHYDFGSVYDAVLAEWWLTSSEDAPFGYTEPSAVWSGTEMLVWGGHGSNFVNSGGRYNPVADSWTMMNFTNAPEGRVYQSEVWTGSELIIWGGSSWFDETDNTGGRYNPTTDTWTDTSLAGVPEGRRWHKAVWTGDEMIVWGGRGPNGELNTGGRYDPATDSWTPVTTSGAPSPREQFSSVWSGDEMIIWGGGLQDSGTAVYDDGARYDPDTDSWTPTSLVNVPDGRIYHVTVWSGTEMIIWGGCTDASVCFFNTPTGGRYNPATDSWLATTINNAPEPRLDHSATWSGTSMMVWGGLADDAGYTHTGGIYYPTPVVNSPPVAQDDNYVATEDETLIVAAPGVLVNDSDPDGHSLSAQLQGAPAHGSLTLNPDGSFSYLPDADFVGLDAFTYRASDGLAMSNSATVTIEVEEAPNSAPAAVDDSYVAQQNETLLVPAPGVLDNDSDPDGDPLQALLDTPPAHGSLTLNPDGSFSYTPDTGFTGEDTFTYRASDGLAAGNMATVTIDVEQSPNSAPTAVDDSYVAQQDETLAVPAPGVLENDSDPDADPITAVPVSPPSNGSVTLNADGSFSYTPDAGFAGTDTFTYRASDGLAAGNIATVTIEVEQSPNNAPTAVDDSYNAQQDETLAVPAPGVLDNDSDPDGDPVVAVPASPPTNGTLTLNADGSFSYTPDAGFTGEDTFTYRASDGLAAGNIATVTIEVEETPNNAPMAVDDDYTVEQDEILVISAPGLLANDNDPDGDPLTAALTSGPANGSATVNSDGSFTYTPNAGFSGLDTFVYMVDDGRGGTHTATVTIIVNAVTPVFTIFLPLLKN